MRARVDLDQHTVTASVRDLVDPPRERARTAGLLQQLRARLGIAAHRRYRDERERELGSRFRGEVAVSLQRTVDAFAATIRGRIDGVIGGADGVTVEEVKSIACGRAELARMTLDDLADHCAQLRLYCLALAARDRSAPPPRARLILISVADDGRREVDVPFDHGSAEALLDELVRAAIAEARAARERARRRAEAGAALAFPYPEPRPGQVHLIDRIAGALASGRPALVAAPTGTGKTVSALLPGLRHALASDVPLIAATAKTTQRGLVAAAFTDIAAASGPAAATLTAVTMRAKASMCPPGHGLCHPDTCALLADFGRRARASGAVDALVEGGGHVSPDAIYARGESDRLCPFELSLEVAARAELIIGDYNHVYSESLDEAGARGAVVLVDEAHNLFDRARAHYSPFVSADAIAAVRERLRAGSYLAPEHRARANQLALAAFGADAVGPAAFAKLGALFARLDEVIAAAQRAHRVDAAPDATAELTVDLACWDELADEAVAGMLRFALYHRRHQLVRPRDELIDLLHEVVRARDAFAAAEPELVPYVAGRAAPGGPGVGALCVDPARRLARCHAHATGTIAMSATLTPLPYFADVLGFAGADPVLVRTGSPFPTDNRRIVVAPGVSTTYRQRERYYPSIAALIERVIALRPGRYVAFFPSFAFLERVRSQLSIPSTSLLVQRPAMTETARARILAQLRERDEPRLLLAVTGGVFAEGVDLPGDALIGAIVVGPALPPVGFERSRMRDYFDASRDSGFAYAMLYPGMQRVVQAAGRVIRTMDDVGVVVLVGRRFALPEYARCLPADWYDEDPGELIQPDPIAALSAFWRSRDGVYSRMNGRSL